VAREVAINDGSHLRSGNTRPLSSMSPVSQAMDKFLLKVGQVVGHARKPERGPLEGCRRKSSAPEV
jgi:hypothetical protein